MYARELKAPLPTITYRYKQPKFLSTEKQTHKMLHAHLVEYYSAIEGIEFSYVLQHK